MSTYFNAKRTLRRKLLRSLQPCREMAPMMSDALEGRLKFVDRLKLRVHLLICAWCSRYFVHIKLLRKMLGMLDDQCDLSQGLSDEAKERIKRTLKDEQS